MLILNSIKMATQQLTFDLGLRNRWGVYLSLIHSKVTLRNCGRAEDGL